MSDLTGAEKLPQGDVKRRDSNPRDETENVADETYDSKEHLEDSLASNIYREQLDMSRPGLAAEVEDICTKVGQDNISEKESSKEEIKEALLYKNYVDMKASMERYKKLDDIKNKDFKYVQKYEENKFLDNARMAYRICCKMV